MWVTGSSNRKGFRNCVKISVSLTGTSQSDCHRQVLANTGEPAGVCDRLRMVAFRVGCCASLSIQVASKPGRGSISVCRRQMRHSRPLICNPPPNSSPTGRASGEIFFLFWPICCCCCCCYYYVTGFQVGLSPETSKALGRVTGLRSFTTRGAGTSKNQ